MAIVVRCGSCGHLLRVKDADRGRQGRCPACEETIVTEGERVPDHDVFISYAQKDKNAATAVCAALEGKGIRCWMAPRDIPAGTSWTGAIMDAIGESRAMVLIYSSHSNRSEQVLRELTAAADSEVMIIPFCIEDTEMSKEFKCYLSSAHWLDAVTPPLEAHIQKLLVSLWRLLAEKVGHTRAPSVSLIRRLAAALIVTQGVDVLCLCLVTTVLWVWPAARGLATFPSLLSVIDTLAIISSWLLLWRWQRRSDAGHSPWFLTWRFVYIACVVAVLLAVRMPAEAAFLMGNSASPGKPAGFLILVAAVALASPMLKCIVWLWWCDRPPRRIRAMYVTAATWALWTLSSSSLSSLVRVFNAGGFADSPVEGLIFSIVTGRLGSSLIFAVLYAVIGLVLYRIVRYAIGRLTQPSRARQ